MRQPDISLLRAGRLDRFSVGRLLRLIASQGFHIEIALEPLALPTVTRDKPKAVVRRYDRFGNPVCLDEDG